MTSNLALAEQALRDDPTVGGCIDFLDHFGVPAMVGPDKGALGAALKKYRDILDEHLADALVDWMMEYVRHRKMLSVPQAVRQYLGARAAGLPLESAKPKLSQAQERSKDALVRQGWPAREVEKLIKQAKATDEEGIIREVYAMRDDELMSPAPAKGARTP